MIQHDLTGAGIPRDLSKLELFRAAFPRSVFGMGCPHGACDGYELMNDLDFRNRKSYASGEVNDKWTTGVGWLPIGIGERIFNADFDGNGYAISNLFIKREGLGDTGSTGLFGNAGGSSEISNVRLLDVNVSGNKSVGGLVGSNRGEIRGVQVTGSVSGLSSVGGLVGSNLGGIVDSSAGVSVLGTDDTGGLVGRSEGLVADSNAIGNVSGLESVGGLLGFNADSGMIVGSHFKGNVTGSELLGGLVGRNDGETARSYSAGTVTGTHGEHTQDLGGLVGLNHVGSSITHSYSNSRVKGTDHVGGLAGINHGSIKFSYSAGDVIGLEVIGGLVAWNTETILASYAAGDVSGGYMVGGLAGGNSDGALIVTSYSVGTVTDSSRDGNSIGGLVGNNEREGRIIDSYWNTQRARQQHGVGRGIAVGASGVNTPQMQRPTGYTGIYSVWRVDVDNADGDFDPSTGWDDLWDFGNSRQYPVLKVDFDGDGVASWEEFGDQRSN